MGVEMTPLTMLMAMNLAPGHNEALITPTELALLHDGLFEVLYQQLNPTSGTS
jgi:hypothetical protein